jgi:serine phosphatase RsbU (regulator of sigma subunit)
LTDVERAAGLDASSLERILAPFGRVEGLSVSLQDAMGRTMAGSDVEPRSAGPRLTRDLRAGGATLGRLVAEGPAATDRGVAAALEALAMALEDLAGARMTSPRTADAPGADPRSGIAGDLALSRLHQRSIVSLVPPEVPGYELASHYEAAREVGGDFFELFRLRRRGHPLGIVIADVAGKGIAAALLMAFARPIIHTALTAASGPADALERTNRILVDEIQSVSFITALVGRLEPASGRVRLANAGHEPAIVVPADGRPVVEIEPGGPLLGVFSPLDVHETEIELAPGDRLVLYTDGVTDSRSTAGERFGRERLLATIERHRDGSAHDLVAAIRDAEAEFRGEADCVDDVTIVAVGRHARG